MHSKHQSKPVLIYENKPTSNYNKFYLIQFIISLCLVIIATITLDHSQLDITINTHFFENYSQTWVINKQDGLYRFIFYDLPKFFLITFEIYLLLGLIIRKISKPTRLFSLFFYLLNKFNNKELTYFLIASLLIPSIIGELKSITQVACPYQLDIFGGRLPYLNIFDSIVNNAGGRCFPAAHASVGFSLYPLVFLPSLSHFKVRIILVVTIFAWVIGIYKMLIGDHFFSHTLVSMLIAWAVSSGMAYIFFKNS